MHITLAVSSVALSSRPSVRIEVDEIDDYEHVESIYPVLTDCAQSIIMSLRMPIQSASSGDEDKTQTMEITQ